MKKTIFAGIIAGAMLTFGSAHAAPMVIDDFNGDAFVQSAATNTTGLATGNSSAGYNRTANIFTDGASTKLAINTSPTLGVYAHSQDSGVAGRTEVLFDLGGIDLTGGGDYNAFRFSLVSADLNGLVGVFVETTGDQIALNTTALIVANGGATPITVDIPFSDFSNPMTNVTTVGLFVDGSQKPDLDVQIDSFAAVCSENSSAGVSQGDGSCGTPQVPEPTGLALLGLALAGFGARRRFQKA